MEAGKISNDQFEKIINYLQGSCMNMEEAIHHTTENDDLCEDDITESQMAHLDQEIFLCTDCNWWCEISEEVKSEEDGEMGCRDCNPDEEDEEDEE